MEIRSYRRVFDLERRVYSVDRMRLNPGGVPVRGIVYFVVILAVGALAGSLPLLGYGVRALPWYLRDLALPAVVACVLSAIRIEGRTFHLAARALVRHACGPRRLAGVGRRAEVGRSWRPTDIVFLSDGSDARMRRLRYTGPGAVLVALEHELRVGSTRISGIGPRARGATLTLRQAPDAAVLDRGKVISLAAGARLLVHAHEPARR
jgi:hypothetical protein